MSDFPATGLPKHWQIHPAIQPPVWLIDAIKHQFPEIPGHYAATLLLLRGIQTPEQIPGFLNPKHYHPVSPFEFGEEMDAAIQRILAARHRHEKIAIWGDFDADGITSTSVLWDGLGQFFPQHQQLTYYIPNRLTESHGLNCSGIDRLAAAGIHLIITCDTGSTNLIEIEYAGRLGIDIIITDHHTLPDERPPAVAIINPRYFSNTHPLFHLSGVAVAYKLIEALYQTLPEIPQRPLTDLLDLVAIGLIADLVQLTGDCRYLAQVGIERLQQQLTNPTRPGVAKLLELCRRNGDRPTDISFGLGPRINAVSRIQGDASFCVELLTSRDPKRCEELAMNTELANSRRKSLQKDVAKSANEKLAQLDLSTTNVIVLVDSQWPLGVLGLVAGQIAQESGRPTILLSTEGSETLENEGIFSENSDTLNLEATCKLARGSARSVHQIDLYQLVKAQAHLLHRFGGHPFAAGLSLPLENIPLFTDAINQQLRQQNPILSGPSIQADLTVTVAELGKELFQELKLLEPCGMGNPVPKLLIKKAWFTNVWHRNAQDIQGKPVQFIKTDFELWDESTERGFPGVWWGHYKDEILQSRCDVMVELDFNTYKKRYEVRLIDLRPTLEVAGINLPHLDHWILDQRNPPTPKNRPVTPHLMIEECPTSWDELRTWFRRGLHTQQPLILSYSLPTPCPPQEIWQQLAGVAKYLSRTGIPVTRQQLRQKLGISEPCLQLGFIALKTLGFQITYHNRAFHVTYQPTEAPSAKLSHQINRFLAAIAEEQFRRQYFYEVPLSTLQALAQETALNDSNNEAIPF